MIWQRFFWTLAMINLITITSYVAARGVNSDAAKTPTEREEQVVEALKGLGAYQDWEITQIGSLVAQASGNPTAVKGFWVLPAKEPNALATVWGHVIVTEPLLELLGTQDEVAFVLAHEMGHLVKQHPRRAVPKQKSVELLKKEAEQVMGGTLIGEALRVAVETAMSMYSQALESEADLLAVQFMERAGFDSEAALTALSSLERTKETAMLFSTHPLLQDRLREVGQKALPDLPRTHPVIAPPKEQPQEVCLELSQRDEQGIELKDQMAHLVQWEFQSRLMNMSSAAFRVARKWQFRRARKLHVVLIRSALQLQPLPALSGFKRLEVSYILRLTDGQGKESNESRESKESNESKVLLETEVNASSAVSEGETLDSVLKQQARVVVRRVLRVVEEFLNRFCIQEKGKRG